MAEVERANPQERVVKVLLPVTLIHAMDRLLVQGVGGFTTRNEFLREAAESYILDLTHEPAPEEPGPAQHARLAVVRGPKGEEGEVFDGRATGVGVVPPLDIDATALTPLPEDCPVIVGEADVIGEPLFGMHNRDYPSLWVARRLVEYLRSGPLTFDEFADRATEEAWAFAEALQLLERQGGEKLTALFPTNHAKRQTASSAFRVFAIGGITGRDGGRRAEGPLFLWRVIDISWANDSAIVGLAPPGRGLLRRLVGLTANPPHPPKYAWIFLAHLREHAPDDWWGFAQVLQTVADRPTRSELIESFRAARPHWRESVAATNAQGYLARSREWGLVTPKVIDGRYDLTELGAELSEGMSE